MGFFESVLGAGGGLVGGVGGGAGGFVAGGGAGVLTSGGILAPPEALLGAGVGTYLGAKGGYAVGSSAGRAIDQKLHDWTRAQKQADKLNDGDQSRCGGNCMAAKKAEAEPKKGKRPPNMAPEGADRDEALAAAKKANGIDPDAEPTSITPNKGKNAGDDDKPIYGSHDLNYDTEDGNVRIRDDWTGHQYSDDPAQDRGPHFNDDDGNHYDYKIDGRPTPPWGKKN